MADIQSPDPVAAKQKIDDALEILKALGMPRGQQNERSALTLLALVDLKPETPWAEAGDPLMGITPIMDFCRDRYGKQYAPNTRETFRRQTMHQFVDAGLAVPNPDDPSRPVNSPRFCYQIEPTALKLPRAYGTPAWADNLKTYLRSVETLKQRYARARELKMVPVTLAEGQEVYLTPGVHSKLVKAIPRPSQRQTSEELAALFQGARPGLVYVTAFLTRSDMARYIGDISWETEVWVKEAGTHLIHFDGKRFLGPYDG